MTVQGLFGNDYSPGSRLAGTGARMADRDPRRRVGRFRFSTFTIAAAALAALALSGGALGTHAMSAPLSAASAGNVEVTLPSAYPDVQLSAVGNQSVASAFAIDQLLEATPSATAPTVVAVALPSNVTVTNGTPSNGTARPLVTLSATLTVFPSNAGLWQGPGDLVQPAGAPLGTADLSIRYALTPPSDPSQGVTTSWTVSGWPWVAPSDLLGLQLSLSTPLARALVACTGPSSSVDRAGCPGPSVSGTSGLWSPGIVGVQGSVPRGLSSLVTWDGFSASGGAAAPVSVGVLSTSPSSGHLLLAAPVHGSSGASGTISFSLLAPLPSVAAPYLVRGETGWYGIGLAAFAAAGIAAVALFRSRGRRAEREL